MSLIAIDGRSSVALVSLALVLPPLSRAIASCRLVHRERGECVAHTKGISCFRRPLACCDPPTQTTTGGLHYSPTPLPFLRQINTADGAMTSEQAAQLIDDTLDLVHQRLVSLEHEQQTQAHKALSEEFREWRHPSGGHIDLMVCPGFPEP